MPTEHQTLSFPGLNNPVEVYRDNLSVPHVFAQNDTDLFMAVGYLQAQDRLFQMDLQRRVAKGELSEILGPSRLETDKFLRSTGLRYAAEVTLEAYDGETLGVLQAFAAGVNARIQEISPHRLPLEFKLLNYRPSPWEALDSIAFVKFMAYDLSFSFEDLELKLLADEFGAEAIEELFPVDMPFPVPIIPSGSPSPTPRYSTQFPSSSELSKDAVEELLGRYYSAKPSHAFLSFVGSNNWVVHGSRSSTGAPILANDPHLPLTLPSIWYQVRLFSPSFNVRGVSLLGVPLVVIGFNERIAWGMTNVGADVVDFFEEQVHPDNEMQYLYRGQWKDFDLREEVIRVKGGNSFTLEMKISVHGPVITSHGETVAVQWTAHRPTFEVRAGLNLTKASNWEDFRSALEDFHSPAQNVVYADAAGNIGMVVNGLFPVRNQGLGRIPVDGSSGNNDWKGFIPFVEIPSSFNPSQGFLVSANQRPTLENDPYLGWSWVDRYRAARINEVLQASSSIGIEGMKALQLDHISVAAREFIPLLLKAFEPLTDGGASLHAKAPDAISLLQDWDFDMDAEEIAPTLYWMWLNSYREATFRDDWNSTGLTLVRLPSMSVLEEITKSEPSSRWFDDVETDTKVEGRDDIIRAALVKTLDDLERELGPEIADWLWGEAHVLQVRHLTEIEALSSEVMARDGGRFTVDVAAGSLSDGQLLVTSGPSWRMIVDFAPARGGGAPEGLGSYPGGQSGNPLSVHYQDMLELWLKGEYQKLTLTEQDEMMAASSSRG